MEYLAQNALRSYPFKDGAYFPLGDDCFLDAQLVPKIQNVSHVNLNYISQLDSYNGSILLEFKDSALSILFTALLSYSFSFGTLGGLATYSDDNCWIKIIFGKGINQGSGITACGTEFCSKTVKPFTSYVKAVDFKTVDTDVATFTDVVTIDAGSNVDIANNIELDIDITPGGGTGQYNDCDKYAGAIRSLSNVTTNSGNFLLTFDSCFSVEAIPAGLSIVDSCSAACNEQSFADMGHYINRVIDGENTLATKVNSIYTNLLARETAYVAALPAMKAPTYTITNTALTNHNGAYYSYAVKLYNPTDGPLTLRLAIALDTSITPKLTTLVPTETFLEGNLMPWSDSNMPLGNKTISITIPCKQNVSLTYVLKVANPVSGVHAGTMLLTMTFTHTDHSVTTLLATATLPSAAAILATIG